LDPGGGNDTRRFELFWEWFLGEVEVAGELCRGGVPDGVVAHSDARERSDTGILKSRIQFMFQNLSGLEGL
jgi:hypothetical protein